MDICQRLGMPKDYPDAKSVFEEIAQVTPSYRGVSYERIEAVGLQWPCPTKDHPGTSYLHSKRIARGRGLFVPVDYEPPMEVPDATYPYVLTTGRVLYQYHTMSMTGKTPALNELTGDAYVEVSRETASRYNLKNGDRLRLRSRRGETTAVVRITDILEDDVLFMPFHFAQGANMLTNTALDAIAKIPELKVCAVSIEKEVS